MRNLIDRDKAIEFVNSHTGVVDKSVMRRLLECMPSEEPEPKEMGYTDCALAILKMWMDEVIKTDEYYDIMDRLSVYWKKKRKTDE